MDEKLDEKINVVLNLIRTNNTAAEALNVTQAVLNLAHAKQILVPGETTPRKQRAGAA